LEIFGYFGHFWIFSDFEIFSLILGSLDTFGYFNPYPNPNPNINPKPNNDCNLRLEGMNFLGFLKRENKRAS